MSCTECALAFTIFGWELNLNEFARLHVPVQPPAGTKPAFRFDPIVRNIGHAEEELWNFLKSLNAPLDNRLSVVFTAQTDDGSAIEDFRAFVAVAPFFAQQASSIVVESSNNNNNSIEQREVAPMRIENGQLQAALASWLSSSIALPDSFRPFVRQSSSGLFVHTYYERYAPEVFYRDGHLQPIARFA